MGTDMRHLRILTLSCAAFFGGCMLVFSWINYDLAASVVGVVEKDDIREFAGDGYVDAPHFPSKFANDRGQLLRIHLYTTKDLVSLAGKKNLRIRVKWHFCDEPEQEVNLGGWRAFVEGVETSWVDKQPMSVVPDHRDMFVYDAILYVRGWFVNEKNGDIKGWFDLEREPRDVCVQVWLTTKMGGYRTNIARIPREEIAAALRGSAFRSAVVEPSSNTVRNSNGASS